MQHDKTPFLNPNVLIDDLSLKCNMTNHLLQSLQWCERMYTVHVFANNIKGKITFSKSQ